MCPLKQFVTVILLSEVLLSSILAEGLKSSTPCDFPAIFNFGDSNSDTGCMSAAFFPAILPYGETFFHEPAGRSSDGRLIIDFIAEHLGFSYLSAYMDSIGTSYRKGANFAAGSSTIRRQNRTYFDGGSPFTLEIQVAQYFQFKSRTGKFYKQGKENTYPRPEDFANSIYTFDIGQNDIAAALQKVGEGDSQAVISDIVEQFAKQVYVSELPCPFTMPKVILLQLMVTLTKNGCVKFPNDMAKEFNRKLKDVVVKLRPLFPDASLVYVDMFSAKYELISNAKKEGFVDPSKICCGYHEDGNHLNCGNKAMINGNEIFAGSCEDPSKYISWDGVHYTDAANRWIANRIVNGSFSDPPLPITHSCHNSLV